MNFILLLNRLPRRVHLNARMLLLCSVLSASSFAQTDTLALASATISAGGSTSLNLTLTSPSGSQPASVQWTMSYSTSSIASLSALAGSAATAASKTIQCSTGSGTVTCIVSGLNANTIQNGTLATINVTLSVSASGTVPINVSAVSAASSNGTSIASSATGGSITVGLPVGINSLNCNPSSLTSGGSSTCTVTLNQAAPAGGIVATVSSSNALMTVPASVTVPAGSISTTFTATAGTITSNGSATVTATYSGSGKTANVSLTAPALISSIGCNPTALATGNNSTCTVTLSSAAPAGGASVTVSSNSGLLTVPASVTVAAGATTATFTATAGTISSNGSATVTATYNSSTQTATLSLTAPVVLSSLGCNQSSLGTAGNSTCTVTLSGAAPSGGVAIPLSSNNPLLTVPASVTVAAGATTGTFTATAGTITSNQSATVTASYLSAIKTAVFSLTAPVIPSSLSCAPASLGSAVTSSCTLTLSQAAPAGGAVVLLSSNGSLLTVPGSVTVPAGSTSNTFSATAGTISSNATAVVTASYNSTSVTATLSLATQTVVGSVSCVAKALQSLSSTSCTVILSQAASGSGAVVSLASDNSLLTLPSSVTVASGAASATFVASAGTITATQTANLTASYNGSSQVLALSLVPNALVSSLACTPATLSSNGASTCTIMLSATTPAGGDVVTLTSNNATLTVPASVTVAAGAITGTFTATAGTIATTSTATVTATYSGSSQQASLSLAPAAVLSSLGCTITDLGSAGTSNCTVTLSAPAASAISIALTSNSPLLTVPASVPVAAGATTATFMATAGTVTANQTVTLTAAYGGTTQQTGISLLMAGIVSSLGCSPANLGSGATSNCTVTLSSAAASGGATVVLASDSSYLTVPASVTVPAQFTTGTFVATAGAITGAQTAIITATYNNSSQTTNLSLTGQTTISSFVCAVSALDSGSSTNCSVTIPNPAPSGGSTVFLASNNTALTVPATIMIAAGAVTGSFTASAGPVNSNQGAQITASVNGGTQTIILTVLPAQTVIPQGNGNSLLTGNYFVRQVFLGTDGTGNLTDPRSAIGTIVFDGAGSYSFTGQLMQNNTLVPLSVSGAYSVDGAGIVSLNSLIRAGDKVNARFGSEAVVGSATESAGTAYDIFVAIPAPTSPTNNSSISGPYWAATLEFPGGTFANSRNAFFSINAGGDGTFQPIGDTGHAANNLSGQLVSEQISGATYSMAGDGSGSVNFGTTSNILSGTKTIYVSQDGNVLLGGTANAYDILIAIKAPGSGVSNSTWSGAFWSAGLRHDTAAVMGFAGSAVASGSGNLYWTRRLKISGSPNVDFTEVDPYALAADGSGTSAMADVAVGGGGNLFLGSSINTNDASGYEIYFGVRMPAVTGTGLYLNPQGVQNVASYAPTGNPIAPGELIYLYVSGLAVVPQTATPPYPLSLGGVTVLINGNTAPIYLVSPTQLVVTVPYATTGPAASIVVQANGQTSNSITVPVAATAPGVFSLTQNGSGDGAIRHADYSVVTASSPAHSGEVVLIYLTGLGAVSPPLADGFGGGTSPLNLTTVTPTVMAGGGAASVLFSGMSAYPGLYQINAQLPTIPAGVTTLPVVITTPNAFHEQVQIPVAP